MLTAVKTFLRARIPEVLLPSFRYFYFRYLRQGRFAINGLDRKLERYIDYENGYFVELGANDGFSQSNTYFFELKKGWRGVLIEPSPHLFMSCLRLRGKNNKVHCNACVGFDYDQKYVDIEYANLMSVSANLDLTLGDQSRHLKTAKQFLAREGESISFGAIAKTLNTILHDSDAPKDIDLLSLDVEGAEIEVLKGVNFEEFRFKFMLIESSDKQKLESFLQLHGYALVDQFSQHDYLFKNVE